MYSGTMNVGVSTLYGAFQHIGAIDEYFGRGLVNRLVPKSPRVQRFLSEGADDATETTCETNSTIGVNAPDSTLAKLNCTSSIDLEREAQLDELRREHNLYSQSDYSRLLCGALPHSDDIVNVSRLVPKYARRLRPIFWWNRHVAPAIYDFCAEVGVALKSYLLPPIPTFPSRLVTSIHMASLEYALLKDTPIRCMFKLVDADGLVDDRRLECMLQEIRTLAGPHVTTLQGLIVDFTTFCQVFSKYTLPGDSYLASKAVACTPACDDLPYTAAAISELVERNTFGITILRPDEFARKHCVLDSNYILETCPRLYSCTTPACTGHL